MTQTKTVEDMQRLTEIFRRINLLADAIGTPIAVEVGQRFVRLVVTTGSQRSVHAFVDTTNGDLIKAASWKAPQKDKAGLAVRGNLLDDEDFARILTVADRYGSYLYK